MVRSGKYYDKRKLLLNKKHCIDFQFLKNLLDTKYKDMKCYYCTKKMSFQPDDQNNLITIERLSNDAGHNKDNVQFSCFQCNCRQIMSKHKF